jgi:uncharacterized membrane protein
MKDPGPAEKPFSEGYDGARLPSGVRRTPNDPLVWAGAVLGMGFGGLADGIVLHSILGWHHLICAGAGEFCQPASTEQLKLENTQDGYFDLALWLVLLAGTAMLFRAARHAGPAWKARVLCGAMLAGCGVFNFLEGLVNHQILGIHHVLPGSPHQLLFDMLFLANGAVFFVVGAWLAWWPSGAAAPPPRTSS